MKETNAPRTSESSKHSGGDDRLALLHWLVSLLYIVFKGQTLLSQAQRHCAEFVIKTVIRWHTLGVGQG